MEIVLFLYFLFSINFNIFQREVDRKDISLKVEVFKEINEKNKNDISLGVATIDLLTLED